MEKKECEKVTESVMPKHFKVELCSENMTEGFEDTERQT